ncbi:MAG: hypothetical protein Q8K72_01860 [Acidimicrobiales bacterium]|nr:hypothetical protein [Acidimicrobiales bacterium]
MSPLRVRREPAPDDGLFVVRGDELVAETLRRDAIRTYRRFDEYGVSVLGASAEADIDELAGGVLRRFEVLTVMTAGALRRSGVELRPTFRRPHYTVMLPDLDEDIFRLLRCDNERRVNDYYKPEELQP